MSFGNNLKLIRKEKGLTQEQLADVLDVSRQAISKWESDTGYPETDKLLLIAKKLGVSLDYLMDNGPAEQRAEDDVCQAPVSDRKIMVTSSDGSQIVTCLSIRYSKIAFPARNEPAYILQAVDRVGFFGAHTVLLGWYDSEADVRKEMEGIVSAMNAEETVYRLKHATDVRFSFWGTASRK